MTTKTASAALYGELDSRLPNWRTTCSNLPEAVGKAGERAQRLHAEWMSAFEARSRRAPALKKVDEGSPFDQSAFGGRQSAERYDEPGNEDIALNRFEDDDGRSPSRGRERKVQISFTASGEYHIDKEVKPQDSLFHPERSVRWTDQPYIWKHRAPRDGGAIRCF